jgi:hypothetical protein
MKTEECYMVLSLEFAKGIKLKSDKIYGHKDIMRAGHLRDMNNRILASSIGTRINIEERFGFNTFEELDDMYNEESNNE